MSSSAVQGGRVVPWAPHNSRACQSLRRFPSTSETLQEAHCRSTQTIDPVQPGNSSPPEQHLQQLRFVGQVGTTTSPDSSQGVPKPCQLIDKASGEAVLLISLTAQLPAQARSPIFPRSASPHRARRPQPRPSTSTSGDLFSEAARALHPPLVYRGVPITHWSQRDPSLPP